MTARAWTVRQAERVLTLSEGGLSLRAVAAQTSLSRMTCQRILKRGRAAVEAERERVAAEAEAVAVAAAATDASDGTTEAVETRSEPPPPGPDPLPWRAWLARGRPVPVVLEVRRDLLALDRAGDGTCPRCRRVEPGDVILEHLGLVRPWALPDQDDPDAPVPVVDLLDRRVWSW